MSISNELYISKKAKSLGLKLIQELNISVGHSIATYLDVNPCFNNHEATLVWVEHHLQHSDGIDTAQSLKQDFLKRFPQSSYSLD